MVTVKDIPFDPVMPIIVGSIKLLYTLPGCSGGGPCHIVTDDHNIEDGHLKHVIHACTEGYAKGKPEAGLCILICNETLKLTMPQRAALYSNLFNNDSTYVTNELFWKMYIEDVLKLDKVPMDILELYNQIYNYQRGEKNE